MSCITHHHACDCREAEFESVRRAYDHLVKDLNVRDSQLSLAVKALEKIIDTPHEFAPNVARPALAEIKRIKASHSKAERLVT